MGVPPRISVSVYAERSMSTRAGRRPSRPDSPWAAELATIPAGAGNPLGTRWIGTSRAAIGIHGTYAEGSIGTAASHGCIRMRIADAEDLFRQVRVGTPIRIHP